ncbi:MAG: hypothetical protein WCN95_14415 [bacterium]
MAFSVGFLVLALSSLFLPKVRNIRDRLEKFAEVMYGDLRRENMPTIRELRCRICGRILRYEPVLAGQIYARFTTLCATIFSLMVVSLLAAAVSSANALIAVCFR